MNMVKWIEIDRSGAFYRLPAPVKSAQHEWPVFRQWGMAYSSSVAAPDIIIWRIHYRSLAHGIHGIVRPSGMRARRFTDYP